MRVYAHDIFAGDAPPDAPPIRTRYFVDDRRATELEWKGARIVNEAFAQVHTEMAINRLRASREMPPKFGVGA